MFCINTLIDLIYPKILLLDVYSNCVCTTCNFCTIHSHTAKEDLYRCPQKKYLFCFDLFTEHMIIQSLFSCFIIFQCHFITMSWNYLKIFTLKKIKKIETKTMSVTSSDVYHRDFYILNIYYILMKFILKIFLMFKDPRNN